MKPAELLQVRTRASAFVDARVRRLLLGTLYEHGQPIVPYGHTAELNRADLEPGRPGNLILGTMSASIDTTCLQNLTAFLRVSSKPRLPGLSVFLPAPRNPLSPPRPSGFNLTARRPSRILAGFSGTFPHWGS